MAKIKAVSSVQGGSASLHVGDAQKTAAEFLKMAQTDSSSTKEACTKRALQLLELGDGRFLLKGRLFDRSQIDALALALRVPIGGDKTDECGMYFDKTVPRFKLFAWKDVKDDSQLYKETIDDLKTAGVKENDVAYVALADTSTPQAYAGLLIDTNGRPFGIAEMAQRVWVERFPPKQNAQGEELPAPTATRPGSGLSPSASKGGPKVVATPEALAAYAKVTTPISYEKARDIVLKDFAKNRAESNSLYDYVKLTVTEGMDKSEGQVMPTFARWMKSSTLELQPKGYGGLSTDKTYIFKMALKDVGAVVNALVDRKTGKIELEIDD
jgi:hypothetical protein